MCPLLHSSPFPAIASSAARMEVDVAYGVGNASQNDECVSKSLAVACPSADEHDQLQPPHPLHPSDGGGDRAGSHPHPRVGHQRLLGAQPGQHRRSEGDPVSEIRKSHVKRLK